MNFPVISLRKENGHDIGIRGITSSDIEQRGHSV